MSHIFKDTAHLRVIYGSYTGHIRDISKGFVKDAAIRCGRYTVDQVLKSLLIVWLRLKGVTQRRPHAYSVVGYQNPALFFHY